MKIEINPAYIDLTEWAVRLPLSFNDEGDTLHAGRNCVKRMHTAKGDLIVKRFKRPNPIQKVAYTFFKKSKAHRAFLYAEIFRKREIDTPQGVAYIEEFKSGLLRDSYFISLPCEDSDLSHLLTDEERDPNLIHALAEFLVKMHQAGIMHGDLNLTNILYHREGAEYRFSLIDTNRTKFEMNPSQEKCLQNLVRLTHDRELLKAIIDEYASLRGWDAKACEDVIIAKLTRFEAKKARLRHLKKMLLHR
jgi:tRNA A-37 threonylcarbamoyl transferase component Bud32